MPPIPPLAVSHPVLIPQSANRHHAVLLRHAAKPQTLLAAVLTFPDQDNPQNTDMNTIPYEGTSSVSILNFSGSGSRVRLDFVNARR